MQQTKYILIIFDFKIDTHKDADCIQHIINILRTETYRNKSIQISERTLLVRVFDNDFLNYPQPKDLVDYAINDLIKQELFLHHNIEYLYYYCLGVNLKDIELQTRGFERKIEYFENLSR